MDIKKEKKIKKIIIVIFLISISILLLVWGPSLIGGILAMLMLVVTGWVITDMELMHPLTWFSPIFFMYSTSMPILVLFQEEAYIEGLAYTLIVEWIALLTFILILGSFKKYKTEYKISALNNINLIVMPIYFISVVLSTLFLFYILFSGLSTKYAISSDQSIFSNLIPFFSIFVLSFLLLFTHKIVKDKKIPIILFLFTFIFSLMILMIAGERDILLRAILGATLIIHFLHKKFKRKYLLIMGAIGVSSIPFLSNFKNFAFGLRERESEKSFIGEIFGGEFRSASRNLNTLITNSESWTFFKGETLIWDIKKATFGDAISPGAWFNQNFYPNLVARGGGNGFTLVGEGYMNFGIVGVILLFAFIAMLLKFLYVKSHMSLVWAVVYIAFVPIMVYAIRGDLATLLTHLNKHILLPLAIIYLIKFILEKNFFRKRKYPKFQE